MSAVPISPLDPVTAISMDANVAPRLTEVSTRMLLVLSLLCGLAILGAFATQLLIS